MVFPSETVRVMLYGLAGPRAGAPGTPPEVIAILEQAMSTALGTPELGKRFAPMGLGAHFEPGNELQGRIAADLAWMTEAARVAQVTRG